jgi:toxin-antitoxin system PIN domain toxin
MIIPDINLLLYAHDSISMFHAKALAWWKNLLSRADTIGLAQTVIFGFVRIGTNSRAYENPMTPAEGAGYVRLWLSQPNVQVLEARPEHVERVLKLLERLGTAGNLVTDAQIAALALEHDAELHTSDADFSRFEGLRWYNPLSGDRSRLSRPKTSD